MNFRLPLVEEKLKRQQVIALHLIVSFVLIASGAFAFLYQYFLTNIPPEKRVKVIEMPFSLQWGAFILLAGFALLALIIFKNSLLMNQSKNVMFRIVELLVMVGFGAFAVINSYWMPAAIFGIVAGAIVFSLFWEGSRDNTLYIDINERGIKLPITSRRRQLSWEEINQVLFRFGILTIDCEDNRLFQWNIRETALDKEKFEQFCKEQVRKCASK
jgi:hypothetical protein